MPYRSYTLIVKTAPLQAASRRPHAFRVESVAERRRYFRSAGHDQG